MNIIYGFFGFVILLHALSFIYRFVYKYRSGILYFIIFCFFIGFFYLLYELWTWFDINNNFISTHPFIFLILSILYFIFRRPYINTDSTLELNVLERQAFLYHNSSFSDSAQDYVIDPIEDKSRDNFKEYFYKREYRKYVFNQFGNRCANCKYNYRRFLQMDHYFMPKIRGGNFKMLHKDGYYVNNCIPLCMYCNKRKSARSRRSFFTPEKLLYIDSVNKKITNLLNKNLLGIKVPETLPDRLKKEEVFKSKKHKYINFVSRPSITTLFLIIFYISLSNIVNITGHSFLEIDKVFKYYYNLVF